jgi:hypothetical protein
VTLALWVRPVPSRQGPAQANGGVAQRDNRVRALLEAAVRMLGSTGESVGKTSASRFARDAGTDLNDIVQAIRKDKRKG